MARIKIAYIGGGSSRAPGTVASFIFQGENFQGSEIVLIDLVPDRLSVVETIGTKMARNAGIDLRISATTERRAGLADCDAVLTSFRPGEFEARYLDESIPLKHGVIGQETQGPGGFFMALRSVHAMQAILADMEQVCPKARIFNYTNPVNLVSEAITHHSSIPIVSLCEGPIIYPQRVVASAGLDPERLYAPSIGVNHGSWSTRQEIDGVDVMQALDEALARDRATPELPVLDRRILEIATTMRSLPSEYYQYYFFRDEILAELQAKPTTRSQDIMAQLPGYWQHYREQAASDAPDLDPARSRGGIHELDLAIDAMDAIYNDRKEVLPVNVPNQGAIPGLPDDLVVEVPGFLDRHGITPLPSGKLPHHLSGIVQLLAEYQAATGEVAWSGNRRQAIQALAMNPLVFSLKKAEVIYDEMAAALRPYLPERLLS